MAPERLHPSSRATVVLLRVVIGLSFNVGSLALNDILAQTLQKRELCAAAFSDRKLAKQLPNMHEIVGFLLNE